MRNVELDAAGPIDSAERAIWASDAEMWRIWVSWSRRLGTACETCCTSYEGSDFDLEPDVPDERRRAYHGRLFCDSSGLSVFYRSAQDAARYARTHREAGPWYIQWPAQDPEFPRQWLRTVFQRGQLEAFVQGFTSHLSGLVQSNRVCAVIAKSTEDRPGAALGDALLGVADSTGSPRVASDWLKAQSQIGLDPADAICRACALVETAAKHVLAELGEPLPSNEAIASLYKAAAKRLGLDAEEERVAEIRGMCNGLSTAVQNIGALRTHYSIAHGRGAEDPELDARHAKLAVNAAGVLATFLMETFAAVREQEGSSSGH